MNRTLNPQIPRSAREKWAKADVCSVGKGRISERDSLKNYLLRIVSVLAGTTAILLSSHGAQAATFTWNAGNSDWDTPANWTPAGPPGNQDEAIINNGSTVTKTGSITLNDLNGTTADGLSLLSGTLNISGDFTSLTNGGSTSSVNNQIGITGGATTGTLSIDGTFRLGNTNITSSAQSNINIHTGSLVTVGSFQGDISPSTSGSATGGYTLNIRGGTFIAGDFDWMDSTNTDKDPTARLVLGDTSSPLGGDVTVTTMSADWTNRAANNNQYALFNDTLGSLTFGKTNFANLSDVQFLIDNDFIRKDVSISDDFIIADNGSSWTVSFFAPPESAAIPEPASGSMLACAGVLLLLRRRRNRV